MFGITDTICVCFLHESDSKFFSEHQWVSGLSCIWINMKHTLTVWTVALYLLSTICQSALEGMSLV